MKTSNGIKCTVNEYKATAIFIKDGEAKQIEATSNVRNEKAVKARISEEFGVKPSKVLVNFETVKKTITVHASYDDFVNALNNADIEFE